MVETLRGSVRTYAWGSRTHLAELLGEEVPSPHPQAELWLGAHRDEPSQLVDRGTNLADAARRGPGGRARPGSVASGGPTGCPTCSRCSPPRSP